MGVALQFCAGRGGIRQPSEAAVGVQGVREEAAYAEVSAEASTCTPSQVPRTPWGATEGCSWRPLDSARGYTRAAVARTRHEVAPGLRVQEREAAAWPLQHGQPGHAPAAQPWRACCALSLVLNGRLHLLEMQMLRPHPRPAKQSLYCGQMSG